MGFAGVSSEWEHELAEIVAMTLADFRKRVADDEFAMFAVECRPADGWISLSMLLAAEAMIDPAVADASRTKAWKHEGIERRYGMWRLAAGVERMMQEPYHCADEADQPAIAAAFIRACEEAVRSDRAQGELTRFRRTAGFSTKMAPTT